MERFNIIISLMLVYIAILKLTQVDNRSTPCTYSLEVEKRGADTLARWSLTFYWQCKQCQCRFDKLHSSTNNLKFKSFSGLKHISIKRIVQTLNICKDLLLKKLGIQRIKSCNGAGLKQSWHSFALDRCIR